MLRAAALVVVGLVLRSRWCTAAQQESFKEEAVVSPLPDGLVMVHFHFTQTTTLRRHYTAFPKAVGQLVSAIPFEEFELSLTQGSWHYQRWGQPLLHAKPAGAEFMAKFSPLLPAASLPGLWGNLSHALGSLFCASLNFVARPEATAVQAIAMRHSSPAACEQAAPGSHSVARDTAHCGTKASSQGHSCSRSDSNSIGSWDGGGIGSGLLPAAARQHVLYAFLPQEASCTENLTPWLKLLPCRDAAGLGALLTARNVVFGADYHSMQVSLRLERDQSLKPLHSALTQSITLVLRLPPGTRTITASSSSSSSSSGGPGQQPPAVLADINLSVLLGSEVQLACPLAQQSRLHVLLPFVSQQQQQQTPQVPASEQVETAEGDDCSAAAAAGADASNNESGGTSRHVGEGCSVLGSMHVDDKDVLLQQQQQHRARRLRRIARAASWAGPGFTLMPAPDAAAVLTHTPQPWMQSRSQLLYVYDLQLPASSGAAAAAGGGLPFQLHWAPHIDGGAPAATVGMQQPHFIVTRHITGSGNQHGGMVLQLQQGQGASKADAAGNVNVCIFQVVPWHVRLWLHTLQLTIEGQVCSLDSHLTHCHVSPAQDRTQPLLLHLCLDLPSAAKTAMLSAQFSKAFLTAFEYPPDAHRGFDVPAAQITVGRADLPGLGGVPNVHASDSRRSSSSSLDWLVAVADGADVPWQQQLQEELPLLQVLAAAQPQQVYSPSLVVPLAVPDFSMPYNVICLTSTVLAVFLGALLNVMLLRPTTTENQAFAGSTARKAARRRKQLKVVLMGVVFGSLGLYLDPSLQEAMMQQLRVLWLQVQPDRP